MLRENVTQVVFRVLYRQVLFAMSIVHYFGDRDRDRYVEIIYRIRNIVIIEAYFQRLRREITNRSLYRLYLYKFINLPLFSTYL